MTTTPGFSAEASVYKSNQRYTMGLPADASATVLPQQLRFTGGFSAITGGVSSFVPLWVRNCLSGCSQRHTACLNNVTNCAVACEPGCIASCQVRCFSLPWWRQLDCLAGCDATCFDSCASSCRIACDRAYGDCVDFCYNPRFVRQAGPTLLVS